MRFHIFCPAHIQIINKILEEKLELATQQPKKKKKTLNTFWSLKITLHAFSSWDLFIYLNSVYVVSNKH